MKVWEIKINHIFKSNKFTYITFKVFSPLIIICYFLGLCVIQSYIDIVKKVRFYGKVELSITCISHLSTYSWDINIS